MAVVINAAPVLNPAVVVNNVIAINVAVIINVAAVHSLTALLSFALKRSRCPAARILSSRARDTFNFRSHPTLNIS